MSFHITKLISFIHIHVAHADNIVIHQDIHKVIRRKIKRQLQAGLPVDSFYAAKIAAKFKYQSAEYT